MELEGTVDRMAETERAERLRLPLGRALAELPPGQRRALELRIGSGLGYADIATGLACTRTAARIRVSRALQSLARALREER